MLSADREPGKCCFAEPHCPGADKDQLQMAESRAVVLMLVFLSFLLHHKETSLHPLYPLQVQRGVFQNLNLVWEVVPVCDLSGFYTDPQLEARQVAAQCWFSS